MVGPVCHFDQLVDGESKAFDHHVQGVRYCCAQQLCCPKKVFEGVTFGLGAEVSLCHGCRMKRKEEGFLGGQGSGHVTFYPTPNRANMSTFLGLHVVI